MLLAIVITLVTLYAGINAFGAWAVLNRKKWVSLLFLLTACLLVIAGVALAARPAAAFWPLTAGLLLASTASLLNARIVIGNVIWRNHLIRFTCAAVIWLLANQALT